MSLEKLGKIFVSSILALSLSACSLMDKKTEDTSEVEKISVLCPTGAPALSILGAFEDQNVTIQTVDGTDVLTSELTKKDSEYDIIIAPTNLGAKIYSKAEAFQLSSVLTWGNLYIVSSKGEQWNCDGGQFAAFGEKAVPQLILNKVFDSENPIQETVTYYASAQEAQQALLSGKVDTALLAQPVAAATISKAKENDMELSVVADLQKMFQEKTNSEFKGYPQAGLFVRSDRKAAVKSALKEIKSFIKNADDESITKAIENAGVDRLGVPNAKIAVKTWDAQNIKYNDAYTVKDEISSFLGIFNIELPDGLIQ